MTMIIASMRVLDLSIDELITPLHASLGIDIQAPSAAPSQELLRIDYGSNNDMARAFHLALGSLCELEPLVVAPGQLVRILHDFENASIVLTGIPRDSHSADCVHVTDLPSAVSASGENVSLSA